MKATDEASTDEAVPNQPPIIDEHNNEPNTNNHVITLSKELNEEKNKG